MPETDGKRNKSLAGIVVSNIARPATPTRRIHSMTYLFYLILPLIFGLAVQGWLKRTFAANSAKPVISGKSGADVAREILDRNGLQSVPVQPSKAGPLSDHYDPRTCLLYTSPSPRDG